MNQFIWRWKPCKDWVSCGTNCCLRAHRFYIFHFFESYFPFLQSIFLMKKQTALYVLTGFIFLISLNHISHLFKAYFSRKTCLRDHRSLFLISLNHISHFFKPYFSWKTVCLRAHRFLISPHFDQKYSLPFYTHFFNGEETFIGRKKAFKQYWIA